MGHKINLRCRKWRLEGWIHRDSQLSERDWAEIECSAEEGGRLLLRELDRSQIDRYLNHLVIRPALEYAVYLLGMSGVRRCLPLPVGLGKTRFPWLNAELG
jgi:hypothetical protein